MTIYSAVFHIPILSPVLFRQSLYYFLHLNQMIFKFTLIIIYSNIKHQPMLKNVPF